MKFTATAAFAAAACVAASASASVVMQGDLTDGSIRTGVIEAT